MIAGARRKGFDKEPEAGRKKPTILDLELWRKLGDGVRKAA
jgi:hypothetical protein